MLCLSVRSLRRFGARWALLVAAVGLGPVPVTLGADWKQFRGGSAMSVATGAPLSEGWKESLKPAWRTPIEGSGWSQPIIVGDRVFVTTAVSSDGDRPKGMMQGVTDPSTMGRGGKPSQPLEWRLVCLSLENGGVLWQETVTQGIPEFGKHASNTYATETPAASEDTLFAFFGAAGVLAAYDFEGRQRWSKSFEPQKVSNDFGTGSSVLLANDRVMVQIYGEESAILYCLSTADGSEIWRAERDKGSAWSTPILWNNKGIQEVVTAGQGSVIAYAMQDGAERWRMGGIDTSFSCSLVADDTTLYYGSSSPGSQGPLGAIAAGSTGDLTLPQGETSSASVRWSGTKSGAGMPSPVIVGDYLYFFGNTVTCYDKKTGKEAFRKRTPGGTMVAGCPIVVGDKIYLVNEQGNTLVMTAGPEFKVDAELSTGSKDEVYWSTPAVANGSLLFRSSDAIYCYR